MSQVGNIGKSQRALCTGKPDRSTRVSTVVAPEWKATAEVYLSGKPGTRFQGLVGTHQKRRINMGFKCNY
jgi:hypothetical protein